MGYRMTIGEVLVAFLTRFPGGLSISGQLLAQFFFPKGDVYLTFDDRFRFGGIVLGFDGTQEPCQCRYPHGKLSRLHQL